MTIVKTYSLDLSSYTSNFDSAMEDETANASGDVTLAGQAFSAWSNLVNFSFQSASPSTASLNILEGILPAGVYGRASQLYTEGGIQKQGIVISNTITYNTTTKAFTYIHEIGHGIGLDHIVADRSLSIMADGDAPNASGKPLPTAPMILDIEALHLLYPTEINYSYKSGNDTYGDGGAKTWTIWDGNGTDTITAASQTNQAVIDLRGGLNAARTDAYWSHIGDEWIAIAYDPNHFTGVVPIEIAIGGSAGDSIYGGEINNPELRGNGGNDTIWGDGDKGSGMLFGSDTIYGDAGNDTLYGDNGQNALAGSSATVGGADLIYGGADDDLIYGEGANDTLYGDAGVDTLYGGQGVDSIFGGADNDVIYGGLGGDYLYGGDGNDTIYAYDSIGGENDTTVNYLYGGAGNDSLVGAAGIDIFYGGGGRDTINGGAGNDIFHFAEEESNYIVDGGAGNDTFNFTSINGIFPHTFGIDLSDEDNNFTLDLDITRSIKSTITFDGKMAIVIRHAEYTGIDPEGGNATDIMLTSSGADLHLNFMIGHIDRPPQWSGSFRIINNVGKDINFGNDLLAYLVGSGKIDTSQFVNGIIGVNVGSAVTGTSAADTLKINTNITDVTGAGGADRFVASNQAYAATIQDFSQGQGDKIDLTAFDGLLTSYTQLNPTGSSNAVVSLPNGSANTRKCVAAA